MLSMRKPEAALEDEGGSRCGAHTAATNPTTALMFGFFIQVAG
jgi:hypothetical protein